MNATLYLVHGTWGRGLPFVLAVSGFMQRLGRSRPSVPLWFENGSPFRGHLESLLREGAEVIEIHFVEVLWSGKNSIKARMTAAESLRTALIQGFESRPDDRHVVIAHSHGGNVAVYALNGLEKSNHPHGIATMATPFLEAKRRRIRPGEARFLEAMQSLAIILTLLTYVGSIFFVASYFEKEIATQVSWIYFLLSAYPFVFVVFGIFERMLSVTPRTVRKMTSDLRIPRKRIGREGRPRFLVTRSRGDEVAIVLGMVRTVALINGAIWWVVSACLRFSIGVHDGLVIEMKKSGFSLLYKVLASFVLAVLVILSLPDILTDMGFKVDPGIVFRLVGKGFLLRLAAKAPDLSGAGEVLTIAGMLTMLFGVPIFLLIILCWLFSGLLLLPFGSELMLYGPILRLRPMRSPGVPGMAPVEVVRSDGVGIVLHSVYQSPKVRAEIAGWIRAL